LRFFAALTWAWWAPSPDFATLDFMNDFAFFRASKSLQVGFISRTVARLIVPCTCGRKKM
jgi:hypothetical protein